MEFRILGPLEVVSNGQLLDLGGLKQRALLAMLLLEANRVVSSDRLIGALWEEEPPETARKALQVYVSQLRKALGKERLQTKAPGYVLRVQEGELDLEQFERFQEAGEVREALRLWRGPALSDFGYQRFAQAEIARLEERRLACLEARIDLGLSSGSHAELTGELEALVKEQPLREGLRGQLMLALYRSGRQAEALEAYKEARQVLVEELGIEPGRQLRELHHAILQQDSGLDLDSVAEAGEEPRSVPVESPATPTPATREMRKTISAVFVGLATASEGGEGLDPEAARRVTSRAFADIQAAVERHGGTVETIAGDSVTAVFGLPAVHEDDALRAVRAAAELRESLASLAEKLEADHGPRLEFRVGVSTGEVVTGGDAGRGYARPASR